MTATATTATSRWLPYRFPSPPDGVRLFCFPNAGGSASAFRPWGRDGRLPARVELCCVQLPGRESRLREPPFVRVPPLLDALEEALAPELDRPFAFFGHSMGTIVAFELAHRLRERGGPEPRLLVMSGRQAPHLPDDDPVHGLPDDELIARLRAYRGTPPEVLAHPELMALVLPTLRADFELVETYRPPEGRPPLAQPITVFGGEEDEDASAEELAAWGELTTGRCAVRTFPGGHFFVHEERDAVLAALGAALEPLLAP